MLSPGWRGSIAAGAAETPVGAGQRPVLPADRFLDLDGLRIHYREWGGGGAGTVLLLHGGAAHAHWWDYFAPTLVPAYRVVAPDLRGHGDSGRPDPPRYEIDDHAHDAWALLDALGVDVADLVGHSLGALVAAACAARFPGRVRSLTLVDSSARIGPSAVRYMQRLGKFPQPRFADLAQAVERFCLLPTQTNATREVLAHVAAHAVRPLAGGGWTLKFDRESLTHPRPRDLLPALRLLACPILVVRGAHSTVLSRRHFEELLSALPNAAGAEVDDAHHHVMLDNPKGFEHAVRPFLDSARTSMPDPALTPSFP